MLGREKRRRTEYMYQRVEYLRGGLKMVAGRGSLYPRGGEGKDLGKKRKRMCYGLWFWG